LKGAAGCAELAKLEKICRRSHAHAQVETREDEFERYAPGPPVKLRESLQRFGFNRLKLIWTKVSTWLASSHPQK
jgi:hypothetical protein